MSIEAIKQALELLAVATFHSPELQAKRTEVIERGLKAIAEAKKQEPVAKVVADGATVRLEWHSVDSAHNAKEGLLYTSQQTDVEWLARRTEAAYKAGYDTGYMDASVKLHDGKTSPVAWIHSDELEELSHCNGMSLWAENALIHTEDSITKQLIPRGYAPLYINPQPKREPLIGQKIIDIADKFDWDKDCAVRFARAIEAVHGIKGQP